MAPITFEAIARDGHNPGVSMHKMFSQAAVAPLLGLTSFSAPRGDDRHYI